MFSPNGPEIRIAIDAARQAAKLCRAVSQALGNGVIEKDDRSPVTVADFGSQALINRALAHAFGNDPIIAEEDAGTLRQNPELLNRIVEHVREIEPEATAEKVCDWIDRGGQRTYTDRFWTLDPIDGTKGFLRGDQYAVALALIEKGRPVVAVLACPNLPAPGGTTGALFTAVRGAGTHMHLMDQDTPPVALRVRTTSDPSQTRFCESVESGHTKHDASSAVAARLGITTEPFRIDSQCKYAAVARGDADIYLRLPTKPGYVERIWDHAAGVLVVEEAGGKVTDLTGAPLDFSRGAGLENNRGVIVTNGPLHEQVLAALHAEGVK